MLTDNSLCFTTSWAAGQSVTTTADGATIVDITGAGSGTAPAMINGFPSSNTAIGVDMGVGNGVASPFVVLNVMTAVDAGNAANTLTLSVSSAPDDGSYGQGTYTVCGSTAAIAGSVLTAGRTIVFPLPPVKPGASLPRFYKVTFTASATLASLKVACGIVMNPPSALLAGAYNANFLAV